jgi:hypothetical protein
MTNVKGKALLVMTRLDDAFGHFRWDINAFIQSHNGNEYAPDFLNDEFSFVEWDVHPAPDPAYKMEVGETLRLSVVYEASYWTDYWGEGSSELIYHKARVLRRQKPKRRYISKKDRANAGRN